VTTATISSNPIDFRSGQIAKLFDKLPPHAIEAECALLGSMILDWHVIGEVVQIIQGADDFYKPAHAKIYAVLVDLYDRHQPVDMVHLNQRLVDLGELEQAGGLDYLIQLVESVPSAIAAAHYARIVHEKAVLRRLIDASGKILYNAYHSSDPVTELLSAAEQEIFRLAEFGEKSDTAHLKELLQELYARLEAHDGRPITGLETGFFELDEITNGLQKGEMIVIAARPSMGKTALALNMAENIAITRKQPAVVFSLEMSKQQLAQRLLCSRSGVDLHRLRRNMLTTDEFARLASTVGELSDAPFFIDDTPGLNLLQMRAKARRLASRHDIAAVFVDYLQLMSAGGAESRQQEVSMLSRGIKAMARELDVPVVCLSQLNRAPELREGHRPRMSDLRESGSIEQDSDVVMMLHREEYFHNEPEWKNENPDSVGVAEVIITKQRNGPTGTVKLTFDAPTTRFKNHSPQRSGSAPYSPQPASF
jgi:replicative DNA helicase